MRRLRSLLPPVLFVVAVAVCGMGAAGAGADQSYPKQQEATKSAGFPHEDDDDNDDNDPTTFAAVLSRFNACKRRSSPRSAEQGVHVWNGAHGHGEVGNVLVGLVHAFIDALLHNRALAVSSEGLAHFRRFGAFPAGDLGTQARLVTLLSTRPLIFSDCHLTKRQRRQPRDYQGRNAEVIKLDNCTESGWEPNWHASYSRLAKGGGGGGGGGGTSSPPPLMRSAEDEACLRVATGCRLVQSLGEVASPPSSLLTTRWSSNLTTTTTTTTTTTQQQQQAASWPESSFAYRYYPRATTHSTCCHDDTFQCVSHAALVAVLGRVDAPRSGGSSGEGGRSQAPTPKTLESPPRPPTPSTSYDDVAASAASRESKGHMLPSLASLLPIFRSFYSSPTTFDKIFKGDSGLVNGAGSSPSAATSSFRFAAAVHLRLSKRSALFRALRVTILLSTRAAISSLLAFLPVRPRDDPLLFVLQRTTPIIITTIVNHHNHGEKNAYAKKSHARSRPCRYSQ